MRAAPRQATGTTLRRANARDVERIARIERDAFSDAWSRLSFHEMLHSPGVIFLVAERSDILGYVIARVIADEGEILNLAVTSDARRQGLGGMLLDAALDEMRGAGVTSVFLEVRQSNATARALYAGRQFRELGRRTGYYTRPVEDGLIMGRVV